MMLFDAHLYMRLNARGLIIHTCRVLFLLVDSKFYNDCIIEDDMFYDPVTPLAVTTGY